MKSLKRDILIVILFMTIGIAAVSSNLLINGSTPIASNQDDFNVYFSDVTIDGEQDLSLIDSKTSLVFNKEFSAVNQSYTISYDVTNASKNYDAKVNITCTQSNEYLSISNSFDTTNNLNARSTKTGTLTITQSKSYTGEDLSQEISCSITASAVERTTQNTTTVPDAVKGYYPMLLASSENDTTKFRADEYRNKITKIVFEDTINQPDSVIASWDISQNQDRSVMAYIIENSDQYIVTYNTTKSDAYDLIIQSNGQAYANPDMSYWFANFPYLKTIEGLNNLNSSSIIDSSYMFYYVGSAMNGVSLDLSGMDFSKVQDASYMFYEVGKDDGWNYEETDYINIILNDVNMSNLKNASHMFEKVGYDLYNPHINIEFNNWDISNVTDMSYMFAQIGPYYDDYVTIDFSDLTTENVTDMSYMFKGTNFTNLNLSNFNTRKVTNMSHMFEYAGWCGEGPGCLINLDINSFDTSNVTDMSFMFAGLETDFDIDFTLDLSHFNTNKVTNMSGMFKDFGTDWTSGDLILNLSNNFSISNATNLQSMFKDLWYPVEVITSNNLNINKATDTSYMFENSYIDITFTISNSGITNYSGMFNKTNNESEEQILVNYTTETSSLVDLILETKSESSNVVKGALIA